MKKYFSIILFSLFASITVAQSKFYFSAGASSVFVSGTNVFLGSDDSYKIKFKYYNFDFEYQRRVLGSFNAVAGISVFNGGYSTDEIGFSSKTNFVASYAAVPLMVRWNPGNRNFYFLDAGMMPFFLLNAHLKESVNRFGSVRTVEGDITPYSNRFYMGYKIQMLIMANRFNFGFYWMAPFNGQSSIKGLESHWGINSQQSTYLLSDGFSDYWMFGLKVGARIR